MPSRQAALSCSLASVYLSLGDLRMLTYADSTPYALCLAQDQHTLREYNIQKPSVLNCLSIANNGRQLENFIKSVTPSRDAMNVSIQTPILLQMLAPEENEVCICVCVLNPKP